MAYSPRRGRQTRGLNAGTHRLENNASPVRLRERARSESSVFQAPAKLHSVPPASVSAGFEGPNGRSARETGEPEENPAYSTIRNPNSLFQVASQRPGAVTLLCFAGLHGLLTPKGAPQNRHKEDRRNANTRSSHRRKVRGCRWGGNATAP